MSFIRADAQSTLSRLFHRWFTHWSEAVAVLFLGGMGLWATITGFRFNGWVMLTVGLAAVTVAILALIAFRRSALARRDPTAAGIVEITEGRVVFLAPDEGGGTVDIRELSMIEIITTSGGPFAPDAFWVLRQHGELPLTIPIEAAGAGELFDAFSALPGISMETAIRAMSSTEDARFLIWQKTVPLH